jgi:hypothetical protein
MFRLSRTSVIAWTAVVAVIAALSYALTGVAVPRAAAKDKAKAAPVEFTADGKLKQPVGYRKWVYVGEVITPNDMNGGEASRLPFHQEPPRQPKSQIRSKHGYWQLHTRRGFGR